MVIIIVMTIIVITTIIIMMEAEVFLQKISENLVLKWYESYSEKMGWLRSRLLFAILRSSVLCLKRSRM